MELHFRVGKQEVRHFGLVGRDELRGAVEGVVELRLLTTITATKVWLTPDELEHRKPTDVIYEKAKNRVTSLGELGEAAILRKSLG